MTQKNKNRVAQFLFDHESTEYQYYGYDEHIVTDLITGYESLLIMEDNPVETGFEQLANMRMHGRETPYSSSAMLQFYGPRAALDMSNISKITEFTNLCQVN